MRQAFSISLIILAISLHSCQNNDGPKDGTTLDQTAFLTNIGENLILKGYEELEGKAAALAQSADNFAEDANADNLNDLRTKWIDAYYSWQKVAFYNFGPAETNGILTINYYPADVDQITENISSGTYNLATAANISSKGFPALDYLLFGIEESDEDIVAYFASTENARTYMVDLAQNIYSLAEEVFNNWSPGGSNYLATFVANKGTNSGSGLSQLVNAWSQYIEVHVRNAKIGIPNGNSVATSQKFDPLPDRTEAYYSKIYTKELLETTNTALKDFYLGKRGDGTDGVGIHDMLIELNAQNGTLANDYRDLFIDVESQLDAIDGTWIDALTDNGAEVTEIFNNYKAIVALLKVDIVSALSISITYADNDGD